MDQVLSSKLINDYQQQLRLANQKVVKVWGYIALGPLAISLPFAFLLPQDTLYLVLFLVFFGLFFCLGVTTLLLRKYFVSEKPLYRYLYPKIIEDINFNERVSLSYEAYPENKELVLEGRLFPNFVSKLFRFRLSFENRGGYPVDVYDAYLFTQSDKSTTVYLDGLYFRLLTTEPLPSFQLRSSGHPSGKDPSFVKLEDRSDPKGYVAAGSLGRIDGKYFHIYDQLKTDFESEKVFLSGVNAALHIGVGVRKIPRKVPVLNQESYENLRKHLLSLVSATEAIYEKLGE